MQLRGVSNSPKIDLLASKKPTVGGLQNQRTSEIKCFKCQGRGHLARDCRNSKSVLFTSQGYVTDEEENNEEITPLQVEEDDNHGDHEENEYIELEEMEQALYFVNRRVLTIRESPRVDQ